MPDEPIRDGYEFDGWYMEETCENRWDEQFIVPSEGETITLYAKWVENN